MITKTQFNKAMAELKIKHVEGGLFRTVHTWDKEELKIEYRFNQESNSIQIKDYQGVECVPIIYYLDKVDSDFGNIPTPCMGNKIF